VACRCDKEGADAVRIEGEWKLNKLDRKDTFTRVHFSQEERRLVYVDFHNRPAPIEFREGLTYNLVGWQKIENRHNVLTISREK
jgi:hypothetical protein